MKRRKTLIRFMNSSNANFQTTGKNKIIKFFDQLSILSTLKFLQTFILSLLGTKNSYTLVTCWSNKVFPKKLR